MRWLDEGIQFDFGSIEGDRGVVGAPLRRQRSMKRALVERVGGYDEERLPYLYEDLDFATARASTACACSTTARAIVDHVRPGMTLEFWKEKARRLAASERAFVAIHPEMEPWFFKMFSAAARAAAAARARREARAATCRSGCRGSGRASGRAARRSTGRSSRRPFLEAWEEAATRPMTAEWLAASSDGGRAQSADSTAGLGRSRGSQPGGS